MEQQPEHEAPVLVPTPGQAIAAWKVAGRAYLVVRVPGDGAHGEEVEYIGSVAEEALARLTPDEQRETLLAAVRQERVRQRSLEAIDVRGLVGPVTL